MKTLLGVILFTLACITCCFCQQTFQKALYVPEHSLEGADVLRTSDNNLLFAAGYRSSDGLSGMAVLTKTDPGGNPVWTYACDCGFIGGFSGLLEIDGYYYGIGTVNTGTTLFHTVLVKISAGGDLAWNKRIDFDNRTLPVTITSTHDGNMLIAGNASDNTSTRGYSWILKADTAGAVVWKKTYKHDTDMTYDLSDAAVNPDGTIYITGTSRDTAGLSSTVSFVSQLDASGSHLWTKKIEGSSAFVGYQKLLSTSPNGCYAAGTFQGGGSSICLSKIENTGNITWTKTYTASAGSISLRALEYSGSEIVFTGVHQKPGDADMLLFKTNLSGLITHSATIGTAAFDEEAHDVVPYNGGGSLLVLGNSEVDSVSDGMVIAVTGSNLLAPCNKHELALSAANATLSSSNIPLTVTAEGSISAVTFSSPPLNVEHSLQCFGTTATADMEIPGMTIFPNPTSGTFSIEGLLNEVGELRIFDVMGKEVYHAQFVEAHSNIEVTLNDGFYFVQLETGAKTIVRKLMVRG